MRCARYLFMCVLAIMLGMNAALAAQASSTTPRIFGTYNCQPTYSCANTDSNQVATLANNCIVQGFGVTSQQTDIFSSSSFDSNNCMVGQLPTQPNNDGHPLIPQCCVTANSDSCSMRCQLLMN